MENIPIRAQDVPVLLIIGYLLWSWWQSASKHDYTAEIAEMRDELEKRRAEMDALLSEQEEINAGFRKFLSESTTPEAVALRERIELLQGRILRVRLTL